MPGSLLPFDDVQTIELFLAPMDRPNRVPYRIIKWPTQVINWPTPLGCLNCWQMAVSGWVRKGGPIYARIGILIEKLAISLMIMDIFQASLFKLGTQVHN